MIRAQKPVGHSPDRALPARIDFLYNTIGVEEETRAGHYEQLFAQARGIVTDL